MNRRPRPQIQEQTTQKEVIDNVDKQIISGGSQQFRYYAPPSALLTALGITANSSDLLADPRNQAMTFKTMVVAFPEVSRTLKYHALIMGCPYIESEDEVFEQEANAMLAEFVWREQLDYEGNRNRGIDSYVQRIALNTMALGQSFRTIVDRQGNPVLTSRQQIDSIVFHDSERFMYWQDDIDHYRLQYEAFGQIEMDKRLDAAFGSIRFDSTSSFPWGKPLLYNSMQIALKAAIMEENQMMVYRGKGSSPRVTIFNMEPESPKDASLVSAELMKIYYDKWDRAAADIRGQYAEALSSSHTKGMPNDLTLSVIGKIGMETHSIADNVQPVFSYPQDIKLALSRLVVSMNGEPSLVGLGTGGDGLNSNRSQILLDSMADYGISLRKTMQTEVDYLFTSQSMRLSRRIPKFTWEWDGLGLNDIKQLAEIDKLKAETQKNWVEAVNMLIQAGEIDAANAFAKEHELEWGVLTGDNMPLIGGQPTA